jgi:hypothetical protein
MAKAKGLRELVRQDTQLSQAPKKKRQISSTLTEKLDRYARLKAVNDTIQTWISQNHASFGINQVKVWKAGDAMHHCGLLLHFRQYVGVPDARLIKADFCMKHLLCPLCSAARAHKLLRRYTPAVFGQQGVNHFMVTHTWPSGSDLGERLALGQDGLAKLWMRKKRKNQGPFKDVLGMISSTEVTKGEAGWHPHFHNLVTLPKGKRIDVVYLRQEWDKLTGGRQIRIDPIKSESDLVEVLKYALKPLDLTKKTGIIEDQIRDRVQAFVELSGRRLLRSYGCYFGMDVEPDKLTEEELDLPFLDFMFRWCDRSYRVVKLDRFSAEGRHLESLVSHA